MVGVLKIALMIPPKQCLPWAVDHSTIRGIAPSDTCTFPLHNPWHKPWACAVNNHSPSCGVFLRPVQITIQSGISAPFLIMTCRCALFRPARWTGLSGRGPKPWLHLVNRTPWAIWIARAASHHCHASPICTSITQKSLRHNLQLIYAHEKGGFGNGKPGLSRRIVPHAAVAPERSKLTAGR